MNGLIVCRFFGWWCLLWVSLSVALAQPPPLRFAHEWGQPAGNFYVTMQDRKGFLWFGSGNNGLAKYDGHRFITYRFDPLDSTSLSSNEIWGLWQDATGLIWIGTSEGACRFDSRTERFTCLERSPANPFAFTTPAIAFNEDKEGHLWAASHVGELRQLDRATGRFYSTDYSSLLGIVSNNINMGKQLVEVIYRDKVGTLWMGSLTGLHQLVLTPQGKGKPSKVSFIHYRHNPKDDRSLSHNRVSNIYEDRRGVLWIGTDGGGLNAFDRNTGTFTRYPHDPSNTQSLSDNRIYWKSSIAEDPQGNLWVGTANGLNQLNPERTAFTRHLHDSLEPTSLINNRIIFLRMEQSGILYVSTAAGVDKVDTRQKPFALYRHNPADAHSLSSNAVNALLEDSQGTLWIGTRGGGLNAFDKQTGRFTHSRHQAGNPRSLVSDQVSALLEDREKNLWVANGAVLSRLDKPSGQFTHFPLKHPFNNGSDFPPVFSLCQDQAGLIWLATTNGIIGFNPQTGAMRSYPHTPGKEGISDYWSHAVLEDRAGNLWIGHGRQALDKLDPTRETFTQYRHDPRNPGSLSSNGVASLYEDAQGRLWLGTFYGGLCRFDPSTGRFTTFTEKHGLAGNDVYAILEDNQGHLWLGTNHGLSKFSPAEQTFTNYDDHDGKGEAFSVFGGAWTCWKGQDGTLYFGGNNGFNAFHPDSIRSNAFVPPVVFTQFRLFDQPQPGKHEATAIELDYDQNFFSLEFAALSYSNPLKNQYAYQLEGVDQDWVYSGNRHSANYTDVDPGEYIFRVKGANHDGVWNQQGTSLTIVIHPPFWRTWWAYGFYLLCLLAGLVAVDRYQRQRLLRREREKTRERELAQAREIEKAYQELGKKSTELEQQKEELQTTLEDLKATQTQLIQKEKMASLGELTAGIAHEIQNPLNFVNNFSEISEELVEELKGELKAGNTTEALPLLEDLQQNLSKIHHHGHRADSIVKGMLQHSRASSGEKQPTDLNALADEYLRLSYHGLRAKDKDFDATLTTDFDPALSKMEVVPQEMGRVLLNLFNNAFQATQQKKHLLNGQYQPEVTVRTRRVGDQVEIRVSDNGTGMPESVQQKIFQPFFTTKPTGEGTGLGLSLSYDIITKGHGGELKVDSREGEGAEFVVMLPV